MTSPPPPHPLPHLGPVDHIGIAVESLEAGKRLYGETFGLRLVFEEEIPTERVRVAGYDGGGMRIELLESTDPDGPIGRFVAKRGPGIHHVCYRVEDVAATLAHLRAEGLRTLDETPRPGAGGCQVAFVHPKSAGGVLIEISQPPAGGSTHDSRGSPHRGAARAPRGHADGWRRGRNPEAARSRQAHRA